jgi:hypothetical protein
MPNIGIRSLPVRNTKLKYKSLAISDDISDISDVLEWNKIDYIKISFSVQLSVHETLSKSVL